MSDLCIKYYLYHLNNPLQKESDAWHTLLPMSRELSQKIPAMTITHADYFHAITSFLTKKRSEVLVRAISQACQQEILCEQIELIEICLEKHGEFYHPARLRVHTTHITTQFVINVAISDVGKARIRKEYQTLKRLYDEFSHAFIPRLYGEGTGETDNNTEIPMFLGEWFDGYHEFHLSWDAQNQKRRVMVWDTENGIFFLSREQVKSLYTQIAMILTYYYHVETFEQIFPWHHAAGDFVIKTEKEGIRVKLITVRDYRPLIRIPNTDEDADAYARDILSGLLLFFLHLSLRIRLDRLDGTGDMIWAEDIAVEACLEGFYQGIALNPHSDIFPIPMATCFEHYIASCTEADIVSLLNHMIQNYPPLTSEVPLMTKHLNEHAKSVYHAIRNK